MKNKIIIKAIVFLLGILSSTTLSSQNIIPDVSARVDISNVEYMVNLLHEVII